MSEPIDTSTITMLDRALKIVMAMHEEKEALGVSELSERLELPKANVYRILHTLDKYGLVEQLTANEKYELGHRFFEIGEGVRKRNRLNKAALPHMKQLARELGETVSLGIMHESRVLVTECIEGEASVLIAKMELVAPLYCSAIGKVLLSAYSEAELNVYVSKEDPRPRTANTIVGFEDLRRETEKVKASGVAFDNEEYEYGLTCIAAPVLDYESRIIAGLSISAPASRLKMKGIERVTKNLVKTVAQINALKIHT